MRPGVETLNDAFALAGKRYDLLCANYLDASANSRDFFGETFIHALYKKGLLDWLNSIRSIFRNNYVDFAQRPLINEGDLKVYLDDDIATANAWVLPSKPSGLEITTTLGLLIILDMLCAARWVHIAEVIPDQPLPQPAFESVCSKTLTATLQNHLRNGLSEVARIRLADFFSNPTEEKRQDWAKLTTLTTLWVLSHEVGHYLCGHLGHNEHKSGVIGLSERMSANSPGRNQEGSTNATHYEVVTIWARELMADAYATIRLSLMVCDEVKRKQWQGSISDVLDSITTASILPGLTFLLGRRIGDEKDSKLLEAPYPSEWCRIFGVFASMIFIVVPLPNTAFDPRKNPIEEFWQDHLLSRVDWQMFLVRMLETFETLRGYLNAMNLMPIRETGWENVSPHWCGSLIGSRTGVVVVLEKSPISAHLLQWMYAMKMLCTRINFDFSNYLARDWMTGKAEMEITDDLIREDVRELLGPKMKDTIKKLMSMNLTNDPAYKILDDWMSNIYSAWQSGEQDILQRQEECALLGHRIVRLSQSI